jgi:hypothetical protein
MRLTRKLLLIALLCLPAMPAVADFRILGSPGGQVGPFIAVFERLRQSGERVIIDGPCYSACTLVLSMLPRGQICITGRAILGFHGARSLSDDGRFVAEPAASRVVLATYPPDVRRWIQRRGGLNSRLLLLRGRDLQAMLPRC